MSAFNMTRLDELQADDAIWGADAAAQQELADALGEAGLEQDASWERSAAVATIALQQGLPSGPSAQLMDALRSAAPGLQHGALVPGGASVPGGALPIRHWLQPNMILAAALLTLSVVVWWTSDSPTGTGVAGARVAGTSAAGASLVAPQVLRQELMQVGDTAVWNWSGGAPEGGVVWHGPSQRGTMTFRGLPSNDPSQRQYQLWIVDGKRNAAHPVDGGVFDMPRGQSEVVIAIDPKILVHEAQAFVVTVEAAGGAVVSDREQIVVLAKPQ